MKLHRSPQEYISTVYVVLLSTVFLLVFPASGYAEIAEFKYKLFLWLSCGYLGVSLLVWAQLKLVNLQKPRLTWKGFHIQPWQFALLYLLFTGISALMSPYSGTLFGGIRRDGFFTIALYVLCFLVLRKNLCPRKWHLALFGVSVTLFCVLGLIQFTGANPFSLYPKGYDYYGANVYYSGAYWSTLGNVDFCVAFLALVAGVYTAALIFQSGKRELLFYIPLCLSVFSILALRSDSGVAALIVGLLFLPSFCVRSDQQLTRVCQVYSVLTLTAAIALMVHFQSGGISLKFSATAGTTLSASALLAVCWLALKKTSFLSGLSAKVFRRGLLLAAVFLLLAGFTFLYAYPGFSADGTLSQIHRLLHGEWDESFGSGRLYIWRQAVALVKEAPLFGGGPDTLVYRGLEGFSRYNEVLKMTVSSEIDAAHNEYLNIFVNQGALALCFYLAFLIFLLVRWWKSKGDRTAAIAGAGAMFYCIQAFFGISMCLVAPYLWLLLAMIDKNTAPRKDLEHEKTTIGPKSGPKSGPAVPAGAVPHTGKRGGSVPHVGHTRNNACAARKYRCGYVYRSSEWLVPLYGHWYGKTSHNCNG